MRPLPLLLGSALLCGCSSPVGNAMGDAPMDLAAPVRIPLLDFDRPVAEVRLGSAAPRKFLVDTGAQVSLLAQYCATELGLAARPYANSFRTRGSTGHERELTHYALFDRLALGDLAVRDCRITLIDDPALANAGIAGILGLDLLARLTTVIDMRERALHLLPVTGDDAIRAWLTEEHIGDGSWANVDLVYDPTPILYVPVDGLEDAMPLGLDTGASRTSFPRRYFDAMDSAATGSQKSEGVGGSLDVATHDIERFDLYGLKVRLEATESVGERGLLGMDVCSKLVLVVDGPARKLWFHLRGK